MFTVSLECIRDLTAVEIYLAEYITYLERYYQAGIFVMPGHKQPRMDGVILMEASGKEQVEELTAEDPLHQGDVTEYTTTGSTPTKVAKGLENYLETIQTDFLEGYCPESNIRKESTMFTLYGKTFSSWLLLGTATYPTPEVLKQPV